MPFTVSHIAAVLPGHRMLSRARVFSAAVIGSMVPDFGLLLPVFAPRFETHSLLGLFTFCLPVGLIAYWLTLVLIKPAMLEIVPDGAYARVREMDAAAPGTSPGSWFYAAMAILLGAITHLVWDAFTHEHSGGVRMFPVLKDYGPEVVGHTLRLYAWLQYGSSIIGLIIVIAALVLWLNHVPQPPRHPPRRIARAERWLWGSLYLGLPLLAIAVTFWHTSAQGQLILAIGIWLDQVAIAGMRASVLSLLIVSLLLRARLALVNPAGSP
ncbi:MAG TPA: DUF4184 family protein [Steroidobacteraceae bacterium]|jgi:hypothetical protein